MELIKNIIRGYVLNQMFGVEDMSEDEAVDSCLIELILDAIARKPVSENALLRKLPQKSLGQVKEVRV